MRRWALVCRFKKNTITTFIEMKLSTLLLILQINFDSHLYNAGERASLPPWGMSRDETRQM